MIAIAAYSCDYTEEGYTYIITINLDTNVSKTIYITTSQGLIGTCTPRINCTSKVTHQGVFIIRQRENQITVNVMKERLITKNIEWISATYSQRFINDDRKCYLTFEEDRKTLTREHQITVCISGFILIFIITFSGFWLYSKKDVRNLQRRTRDMQARETRGYNDIIDRSVKTIPGRCLIEKNDVIQTQSSSVNGFVNIEQGDPVIYTKAFYHKHIYDEPKTKAAVNLNSHNRFIKRFFQWNPGYITVLDETHLDDNRYISILAEPIYVFISAPLRDDI